MMLKKILYCDRANFIFAIHGMKIPKGRTFRCLRRIRKLIGRHLGSRERDDIVRAPSRRDSAAKKLERNQNVHNLPVAEEVFINQIRMAVNSFLAGVHRTFAGEGSPIPFTRMWYLTTKFMGIINQALQRLDNTWVEKYGTVVAADLQMNHPSEFLDFIRHANKFDAPNHTSIMKKIKIFEMMIHVLGNFGLTLARMESLFMGDYLIQRRRRG